MFLFGKIETNHEAKVAALSEAIKGKDGKSTFLVQSKTGNLISPAAAFDAVVRTAGSLFDDIEPNTEGKVIKINARYADDEDYLLIETPLGRSRIQNILFEGSLVVKEKLVPISETVEYRSIQTGEPISQVVSFSDQTGGGANLAFEFHKIAETGEIHVILRRIGLGSTKNLKENN